MNKVSLCTENSTLEERVGFVPYSHARMIKTWGMAPGEGTFTLFTLMTPMN